MSCSEWILTIHVCHVPTVIMHVWLHTVWCYLLLQRSNICLEFVLHVCKAAVLGLVCFESSVPLSQLDLKLTQLLLLGIYLQPHRNQTVTQAEVPGCPTTSYLRPHQIVLHACLRHPVLSYKRRLSQPRHRCLHDQAVFLAQQGMLGPSRKLHDRMRWIGSM